MSLLPPDLQPRRPPSASRFVVLLAAALGAVLVTTPTWAQDLTADRVAIALEATDRRIEQAEAIAGDERAAEADLAAARDLQGRAREAFVARQLDLAMRLTLDARRHADRAIALVRGLPDPDRVEIQLERTRELLHRARDRVEECDQDRARSLVRSAFDLQARAEEAARSGRFLAALRFTLDGRERARRALQMCRMDENLSETAQRALQRTDEAIARAESVVDRSTNELARESLLRATALQSRAYQDYRAGYLESCLRQTQSARSLAYRAARIAGRKR